MNDDTSIKSSVVPASAPASTSAQEEPEKSSAFKNWLEKVGQSLQGEIKNRDRLLDILREAESNNLIDTYALLMIEGVMQVSEMQVRDIMIPRSQMAMIDREKSLQEILKVAIDSAHSRFPVISDNKDEVIGVLLAKDLLPYALKPDSNFTIRDLLRPAVYIPESKRLNVLLNEFRSNRNHMAIVVDEYGGIAGLVTIEDVLEQIVGEIEDEHDIEEDIFIIEHENGNSIVKAITPISDFNEHFASTLKSDEFETIGGIILDGFGHVPKRGEEIILGGYLFRVLRASGRRVHLLEVQKQPIEDEVAENNNNERKTG